MKTTIIILAGSILLFSCNIATKEQEKAKTENVTQEPEHQHDKNETIALNKGERWKVDENMITHIRNMENDVSVFKGTTLTEYKTLSENLQKNVDLLTSNCTMKGKAHDELHKWLLPYIDLVQELSEAKDETKAAKQFEYIQTSFSTFNQYFQ